MPESAVCVNGFSLLPARPFILRGPKIVLLAGTSSALRDICAGFQLQSQASEILEANFLSLRVTESPSFYFHHSLLSRAVRLKSRAEYIPGRRITGIER